jgi:hypothetical protein
MFARTAPEASLRLDYLESSRLAWAFALSIAFHLLVWGAYSVEQKWHVWEQIHWPGWVQTIARSLTKVVKKEEVAQAIDREPPLMFVDVSPQQATAEPPRNAAYYSDKNSRAANPEADKDTGVPKIAGTQTHVPQTEDVPRNQFDKLQPATPAERAQPAEPARARPVTAPGDLTLAKPELNPREGAGTAEQPRPRTIQEALARQPNRAIPGQKMKQEGGVRTHLDVASLDAKATPFGAYDAAFIDAVRQRWFDLLDNLSAAGYRHGMVMVQFHLNYDGRISDMKVLDNTVGDMLGLLCVKAVQDPSPFEKWPREMRQMVDRDYRELRFTFFYD